LGFSFLENCNRHRHRFYCQRKEVSYRLKDAQLPTEGCSVTDWFQRQWIMGSVLVIISQFLN